MKTSIVLGKFLLMTLAVSALLFLGGKLWLRSEARSQYQNLVAETRLVESFQTDDTAGIRETAREYALEYQKTKGRNIIFSSRENLPQPTVIPVATAFGKGVLRPSANFWLSSLEPYVTFIGWRPYLLFVLTINDSQESESYLIYQSLLSYNE